MTSAPEPLRCYRCDSVMQQHPDQPTRWWCSTCRTERAFMRGVLVGMPRVGEEDHA